MVKHWSQKTKGKSGKMITVGDQKWSRKMTKIRQSKKKK